MALTRPKVELHDLGTYIATRCDSEMMTELGGLLPRDGIEYEASEMSRRLHGTLTGYA